MDEAPQILKLLAKIHENNKATLIFDRAAVIFCIALLGLSGVHFGVFLG